MAWNVHFGSSTTVGTVQFYGREMKVSVPVMTSNTAPYGEAFDNAHQSGKEAWHVFDGNMDNEDYWSTYGTSYATANAYVGYRFVNPTIVRRVWINFDTPYYARVKNFRIEASNNGSNYTTLFTGTREKVREVLVIDINNNTPYFYYRLFVVDSWDNLAIIVNNVQFYGFDYSEYDWDEDNPRHYLYDHGVELETITPSVIGNAGTITKEPSDIKINRTNGASSTDIMLNVGNTPAINMTPYQHGFVRENGWVNNNGYLGIFIAKTFPANTSTELGLLAQAYTNNGRGPLDHLDISNVNENAHLLAGAIYTNGVGVLYVNEMWLE
jgi:hypothetical protein